MQVFQMYVYETKESAWVFLIFKCVSDSYEDV